METIFGRTYNTVGSSNSDFIIKTRGLVKIQYGNKFIDLIKDGKINSGALDFITIVENKSDIGTATGIYYVKSTGTVHIVVDGKIIDLVGDDIGTTYVSFLGKQEVTGDQKHLALTNIGFLYETMLDALDAGIESGIIFVEESNKLYIVTSLGLIEYKMSLPSPITELVVILKDNLLLGALIIKGIGKENSLIIGDISIYLDPNGDIIDSEGGVISIRTLGGNRIIILNNITMAVDTVFLGTAASDMFKSLQATSDSGFRLYILNEESYLEVDNLIVRNSENSNFLYPIYWATDNNIISSIKAVLDGTLTGYEVALKQENTFLVGDLLSTYVILNNPDEGFKVAMLLFFKVESINTEGDRNVVYASLLDEYIDTSLLSLTTEDELFLKLSNQVIHLCASEERDTNILRFKDGNIDTLSPKSIDEELNLSSIHNRFGNLNELALLGRDNELEVPIEGLGIYSDNGAFLKAQYTKDYILPDDDNSSKLASTEWVKKLLEESLTGDADLYYGNKNAKESDISSWISSNSDLVEVIQSATEEKSFVACKNGMLTVQLVNGKVRATAFVSALTEDDTISHRSIDCMVDPNTFAVDSLSTYILFTRYAGYYYSKSANASETQPILFFYYGTNLSDFNVSKEWPYIWYWNNIEWRLVDKYIEDTKLYLFIRTTNSYSYRDDNTGKGYILPGGFIQYVKDEVQHEVGLGMSNYVANNSTHELDIATERLIKLLSLIVNPTYNSRPSNSNYGYLWCIESIYLFTDLDKWQLISLKSSTYDVRLQDTFQFGNCSTPSNSGWDIYVIDDKGTALSLDLGDFEFKKGQGSIDNWKDKIWVKSFIRYVLCSMLTYNTDKYNSIAGWDFHWNFLSLNGYGGLVGIYMGESLPPTSDDPNSPDYRVRVNTRQVTGTLNSYGYVVLFDILGLSIGDLYKNIGMGLGIQIGQICSYKNFFYDVDFTSYSAIVTDLSTGNREHITG